MAKTGLGSRNPRPAPRLVGDERESVLKVIRAAMKTNPVKSA